MKVVRMPSTIPTLMTVENATALPLLTGVLITPLVPFSWKPANGVHSRITQLLLTQFQCSL